ncbi:MAG TPA: hypothetical protein VGD52_17725 [Pseudoduganella sp.]
MKLSALTIGLLCVCMATVANGEECDKIKFSNGKSIVMRSALVEARNGSMEWPWGMSTFSVSIRPPAGDRFADLFSIIVEPDSEFASMRSDVCADDSGRRSCTSYVTPSSAVVTIYFKNRDGASRELLVQEVRDYVDKKVLTCP